MDNLERFGMLKMSHDELVKNNDFGPKYWNVLEEMGHLSNEMYHYDFPLLNLKLIPIFASSQAFLPYDGGDEPIDPTIYYRAMLPNGDKIVIKSESEDPFQENLEEKILDEIHKNSSYDPESMRFFFCYGYTSFGYWLSEELMRAVWRIAGGRVEWAWIDDACSKIGQYLSNDDQKKMIYIWENRYLAADPDPDIEPSENIVDFYEDLIKIFDIVGLGKCVKKTLRNKAVAGEWPE